MTRQISTPAKITKEIIDFWKQKMILRTDFAVWLDRHALTKEHLEQLAIAQDQMINEREDELKEMQKEDTHWTATHWYWLLMYLLGIGTGTMGVLLYQALQSTYNLV